MKTNITRETLLIFAILVLVTIAFQQQAHALCLAQPEDGKWVNADSQTQSITRVELRFTCQDQILNGQLYPPGPPWHVRIGANALHKIVTGMK